MGLHEPFGTYGGLRVIVVAEPKPPHWTKPGRPPTKAEGRRGTRRAWKRRNPPRFVIPVAVMAPDAYFIDHARNTVYCRAAGKAALAKAVQS